MKKCLLTAVVILLAPTCLPAQALGDLSYHIRTNSIAQTNNWGANPLGSNGAEAMFLANPCLVQYPDGNPARVASTNWATTQPLVRNTNFWLHFAPEITAIPERFVTTATGGTNAYKLNGQGALSAISPRHIMTVDHMLGVSNTNDLHVLFIDDRGSNVVRSVIGVVELPNVDLDVGILDADLPPTVHPFKFLPLGYTNYLPELMLSGWKGKVQLIVCDQWRYLKPALWLMTVNSGQFHLVNYTDDSPIWLGTNGNRVHIGGDSGCPFMALVGTNLVYISAYDTDTAGPDASSYAPDINTAMHYLSTNYQAGSDYQLKTYDLSDFVPNHRPPPPNGLHVVLPGP